MSACLPLEAAESPFKQMQWPKIYPGRLRLVCMGSALHMRWACLIWLHSQRPRPRTHQLGKKRREPRLSSQLKVVKQRMSSYSGNQMDHVNLQASPSCCSQDIFGKVARFNNPWMHRHNSVSDARSWLKKRETPQSRRQTNFSTKSSRLNYNVCL